MTYIYFGGMTYIDTLDTLPLKIIYIQSMNIGHTSKANINIWYTYKFIDFIMV